MTSHRFPAVRLAALAATALTALSASSAEAASCVGSCGTGGPDGVVTAPPNGAGYRWISTAGGANGVGQIGSVGGTDGSQFTSSVFSANAGDNLQFYFDYVTSDGQQPAGVNYEDYTWAQLQTDTGTPVAMLYTARTEPSGTIVPGNGLGPIAATLTPGAVPIIPGAPAWSPLGGSSGTCWGPGCGFTDWVRSDFTIGQQGNYQLVLGVTNFVDTAYDSGLAFNGLTIANNPIDDDPGPNGAIPEPATWAMMIVGLGGAGAVLRRRRRQGSAMLG